MVDQGSQIGGGKGPASGSADGVAEPLAGPLPPVSGTSAGGGVCSRIFVSHCNHNTTEV